MERLQQNISTRTVHQIRDRPRATFVCQLTALTLIRIGQQGRSPLPEFLNLLHLVRHTLLE
jgi:hypothetical protein